MKRLNNSMLTGPLLPNIILYTIPIILTSFLQLLFNAADLVIVGRFCGSISVAAVGATGAITNLMVNFFVGLSVGAGVTVAHALGSREDTVVHNTVHTAMPTALVSGIFLTVAGVSFSETFLRWMGTPDTVLPLSSLYMKIYFAGITFTMVYNFCAAILRAAGDTKSPLIFLAFAFGCNMGCSVIVSQLFGAKEYGQMKTAAYTAMLASGAVCLGLMLVGLLGCDFLLDLINTPEEVFADSKLYLDIYIWGLPFVFFYNIATGIFSALGDSRTPFLFLAVSSLSNIAMDILFVTAFQF